MLPVYPALGMRGVHSNAHRSCQNTPLWVMLFAQCIRYTAALFQGHIPVRTIIPWTPLASGGHRFFSVSARVSWGVSPGPFRQLHWYQPRNWTLDPFLGRTGSGSSYFLSTCRRCFRVQKLRAAVSRALELAFAPSAATQRWRSRNLCIGTPMSQPTLGAFPAGGMPFFRDAMSPNGALES